MKIWSLKAKKKKLKKIKFRLDLTIDNEELYQFIKNNKTQYEFALIKSLEQLIEPELEPCLMDSNECLLKIMSSIPDIENRSQIRSKIYLILINAKMTEIEPKQFFDYMKKVIAKPICKECPVKRKCGEYRHHIDNTHSECFCDTFENILSWSKD